MSFWCLLCFFVVQVLLFQHGVCESAKGSSVGACKITEPENPCYKKRISGEKLIDYNIKRHFPGKSVDDCIKICDAEKSFVCEGFNYRHSNRSESHGFCELKSIPHMKPLMSRDLRYDYYERDYNCRKNNAQRGGNYIQQRSDFSLPLTTEKQFKNSNNMLQSSPLTTYDNMFYKDNKKGRQPYQQSDGRSTSGFYNVNEQYPEIVTIPSSRKNSSEKRGVYETTYSGSYGYSTNSITYLPPKLPGLESKKDDKFAGEIGTHYRTTFGYENTRVPLHKINDFHHEKHHDKFHDIVYENHHDTVHPKHHNDFHSNERHDHGFYHHDDPHHDHHCFVRAKAGFKIERNTLRKSCLTLDLKSCEENCKLETDFNCQTFAYRYVVDSSNPADNCLMSDVHLHAINLYTDLEPDKNYDVYSVQHDSHVCSSIAPVDNRHIADDCFWRVKSGFSFPQEITRIPSLVKNIGQCQHKCIHSHNFICRSFVFRYEDVTNSSPNCFLTDQSTHDFDHSKMIDMDKAEMYERNSYERGCEPYPFFPNDSGKRNFGDLDETCYSGHSKHCKLLPSSVRFSSQVNSELDCRRQCSSMRRKGVLHCMSYSYGYHDVQKHNCFMSDLGYRDLRPHHDYAHDDGHVLYSWEESDSKCLTFDHHHHHHDHHDHHNYSPNVNAGSPLSANPHFHKDDVPELHFVKLENGDTDQHIHYHHYHTDVNNLDPGSGSHGVPHQDIYGLWPDSSTIFRRFTVNGYPCKKGTACVKNQAGFWSCEAEGSEPGSWDYCCEPNHHCGYSEGYNYPWCYVGTSKDQWRPCSEQYYPNGFNPNKSSGCSYKRNRRKCEGRHWPVTYLHSQSPPTA